MWRFDWDEDSRSVAGLARDFGRLAMPFEREAAAAADVPKALTVQAEEAGLFDLLRPEGAGGLGLSLLAAGGAVAALVAEAPSIGTALLWPEAAGIFGAPPHTAFLDGGGGTPAYLRPATVSVAKGRLKGRVAFAAVLPEAAPAFVVARDGDQDALFAMRSGIGTERVRTMGLEPAHLAAVEIDGEGERKGVFGPAERTAILCYAAPFFHGYARAALSYARDYAARRQAFGQAIGAFQGVAFHLSEMAMENEAAELLWQEAAWAHARGESDLSLAAQALRSAKDTAWKSANGCVGILGGHGFVDDHPAERWLRDVQTLSALTANRSALAETGRGLFGEEVGESA